MPNTGKPSKDCHLCRSRRVKCDLGRPACQRCIKYGAECPGYRTEQDLVFRNSNPTTVKKRKKRTQQASREASEALTFQSSSSSSSGSSPPTIEISTPSIFFDDDFDKGIVLSDSGELVTMDGFDPPLMLPQSLHEHWTAHSIPIILNVYSTLDFVQSMYRKNINNGPLVWAAHLFSRTYVVNLRYPTALCNASVKETERELGGYLGKTLSAVSEALKTPDGAMRDDVLATVWILANYELLLGSITRMEPMSPWHLHSRGLYSMLKTRGTAPLYTEAGRQAFWPAYNLVQVQSLLTNTECPPESDEWLGILKDFQGPQDGLGLNVCIFITKVCHVQARILTILRGRNFAAASAEYRHLIDTMEEAEAVMRNYFESRARFAHIMDPYMKNMYWSACVKCYHVLLLFVNFVTHHLTSPIPLDELKELRIRCVRIVRTSAQEIMGTLPVTLNPIILKKDKSPRTLFDALKLIWPLTAVYIITSVLPKQRKEAEMALRFIGQELGVKQALRVYPGKFPLPPEAEKPLEIVEVEETESIPLT
ncbi:Fc.00g067550.m01.CDS01 [Cosmosporella sp. VM-42]